MGFIRRLSKRVSRNQTNKRDAALRDSDDFYLKKKNRSEVGSRSPFLVSVLFSNRGDKCSRNHFRHRCNSCLKCVFQPSFHGGSTYGLRIRWVPIIMGPLNCAVAGRRAAVTPDLGHSRRRLDTLNDTPCLVFDARHAVFRTGDSVLRGESVEDVLRKLYVGGLHRDRPILLKMRRGDIPHPTTHPPRTLAHPFSLRWTVSFSIITTSSCEKRAWCISKAHK